MGVDKATLLVDGRPMALRIAEDLDRHGYSPTVLGREPIQNYPLILDEEKFSGPVAALAKFRPKAAAVFVTSCDLPLFDARLVDILAAKLSAHDAAVPFVDGFRQPLCALYRSTAFELLSHLEPEDQCPMGWLDRLNIRLVTEQELEHEGISPSVTRGANTPEELARLLSERNPSTPA